MSLLLHAPRSMLRGPVVALVATFAILLTALATAPAAAGEQRIAGADRVETSAKVAAAAFPSGAGTAVVARADNYPDALAAAGLAGRLGAPVLLTTSSGLAPAARDAVDDLGVSQAVLLGGRGALGSGVARDLERLGVKVRRVSGSDRYATAAAIARDIAARGGIGAVGGRRTAFLASGDNFPDALAAGAPAYAAKLPLLLTAPSSLPPATTQAIRDLGIQQVVILGGTGAVSDAVAGELGRLDGRVQRVGGRSRAETAARVADYAVASMGFAAGEAVVVRGDDFPDALSAGPLGGSREAPILLSGRASASPASAQWLADNCKRTSTLRVLGGSRVISSAAVSQAATAMEECRVPSGPSVSGDWPDADSTGVPAGVSLRSSGSVTVTKDGTVIDGLHVKGMITVRADNVTIRRTRIETNGSIYGISIGTDARGTVIEDSTILGTDNNCRVGIVHAYYTVRRTDISGCVDGLRIGTDTTIEDSYVHDLRWFSGAHTDAVQTLGGANIRIVGNRLEGRWRDSTSAIIMGTHRRSLENILIEGNLLAGGTYTLYLGEKNDGDPPPSNVRLTDNVWLAGSWKYGTHSISSTSDVTWSGNRTSDGKSLP